MTADERLTRAIARRRAQLSLPCSPDAEHSAAVLDLLTAEERAQDPGLLQTPPTLDEALAAMGFSSVAEIDAWSDHPDRTSEDIVVRYEDARDVIRHWLAMTGGLDLPKVDTLRTPPPQEDPIEDAISSLVSRFLSGDREDDLGDILDAFPSLMAGYITYQTTVRLARRAADAEVERLGCWLAVHAFQQRCQSRSRPRAGGAAPPSDTQE